MALRHPRSAHLLRPSDFTRLRESGYRLNSQQLCIQYGNREEPGPRLGMAVSRRVSKLAVVRNRIRRQVRESFRLHRARLPAFDILVIARQSAAQQTNAQLRAELESLWLRLVAQAATIER